MFFKKKKNKTVKCDSCRSNIKGNFRYCPYCGNSFINLEKEQKDFGILGRSDTEEEIYQDQFSGMGITDKFIGNLINSLMKSLDKQFKTASKDFTNTEVKSFPNGIKIRIGPPVQRKKEIKNSPSINSSLTKKQLQKMAELPRTAAKTSVRRIGNKIVYELNTPGLKSKEDVFVSKIESGYEVKAIGNKKVYINSLPLSLPLRKLSIIKNKLLVEFNTQR